MGLFEYERQIGDLTDKYNQDEATNAYARFVSQQRFKRNREGMNRGFQRAFPQFTGGYAGRLGSGVRSGVFREKLGQFVGDYNRNLSEQDADFAAGEGDFEQMRAMRAASYQRALLALREQLAAERVKTNPYAFYM